MSLSTSELQRLVGQQQVLKKHSPVCENIRFLPMSNFEADLLSVSSTGYYYEFEVKISRSDFLRDKTKGSHFSELKHEIYATGLDVRRPNYFSYVCPADLISVAEIPPYAGLYYERNGGLEEVRKPQCLHRHKHDLPTLRDKINRVYAERRFLGCCLLTYKNRLVNS